MKTKAELVAWCESKLGTPYVYGAKGAVLTQSQIDNLAALYPSTFTASYIAKAKAFIGQRCTDCSGLISWLTGKLRGSSNYKDTAVQTLAISRLDESMIGWAVWKSGHIGLYIGNGYCIEAKGIDYGTVKTKVSASSWTHVLKLCDIDYTEETIIEEKKSGWVEENGGWRFYLGDTGEYVRNDWYRDGDDWYWFDRNGMMVADNWRIGPGGKWYYMADSGAMAKNKWAVWNDELYRLTEDGSMYEGRLNLKSDEKGALQIFNSGVNDLGYVKDGLYFCLDGVQNTRDGHDGSVTTFWHDISGNSNDPVLLGEGGMAFGDANCALHGSYLKIAKPESGWMPMTFQIVCQTDEDLSTGPVTNYQFLPCVAGCSDTTMFRIGITEDDEYGISMIGVNRMNSMALKTTKRSAFSITASAPYLVGNVSTQYMDAKAYADGGAVAEKIKSSYKYTSDCIYIGKSRDSNAALPWKGKIYSVRIYNRELSQEELDYNYMIDKIRFNIQ